MCVCVFVLCNICFRNQQRAKRHGVFCGAIRSVALNCRQSLKVCVRVCAEALRSINLHADRDEQEGKIGRRVKCDQRQGERKIERGR